MEENSPHESEDLNIDYLVPIVNLETFDDENENNVYIPITVSNEKESTYIKFKSSTGNRSVYNKVVVKKSKSGKYNCPLCRYKGKILLYLKKHIKNKHHPRPYKCSICGYKASMKCLLKRHMVVHSELKRFACQKCSYTTSYQFRLNQHLIRHEKGDLKTCPYCNFTSLYQSTCDAHVLTHKIPNDYNIFITNAMNIIQKFTCAKTYNCQYCPFTTIYKYNLQRHTTRQHKTYMSENN